MLFKTTGSEILDEIIIETEYIVKKNPHEPFQESFPIIHPAIYRQLVQILERTPIYDVLVSGKRKIGIVVFEFEVLGRERDPFAILHLSYIPN